MEIKKIIAITMVVLMVATAGVVVVADQSSAEADTSTATVKVYYNASGSSTWSSSTQDAYNLYLAVYGARTSLGYSMATTGPNALWYVTEASGYSNPNTGYGLIEEINGSTNFTIYGYNNSTSSWDDISALPLGWLRPYADYSVVSVVGAQSSVYANVAIVQGSAAVSSIATTDLMNPISVQGDSSYYYTFFLCDSTATVAVPEGTSVKIPSGNSYTTHTLTDTELRTGITVCGYGSDAYLALLDAVGSSLVGQTQSWIDYGSYKTYYSWMTSMFGVGTVSESNPDGSMTYYYWMSTDDQGNYLNWTLGYYSTVYFDAANVKSNFVITYAFS